MTLFRTRDKVFLLAIWVQRESAFYRVPYAVNHYALKKKEWRVRGRPRNKGGGVNKVDRKYETAGNGKYISVMTYKI